MQQRLHLRRHRQDSLLHLPEHARGLVHQFLVFLAYKTVSVLHRRRFLRALRETYAHKRITRKPIDLAHVADRVLVDELLVGVLDHQCRGHLAIRRRGDAVDMTRHDVAHLDLVAFLQPIGALLGTEERLQLERTLEPLLRSTGKHDSRNKQHDRQHYKCTGDLVGIAELEPPWFHYSSPSIVTLPLCRTAFLADSSFGCATIDLSDVSQRTAAPR